MAHRPRNEEARSPGPRPLRRGEGLLTDQQLLEAFLRRRDERAFAALVERHGPMVLAVCRHLLHNAHDAEDAFQATFLVLVRKAGQIREPALLGNWLYGVAHRVAARARARVVRQRERQEAGVEMVAVKPAEPSTSRDLQPVLHEEVNRLPDRYRAPVVLCYLEGRSNEEAARDLNCPVGTVKGRLARARALLRSRLTRRGVALSAGLLAAELARGAAAAAVPAQVLRLTVQAALRFAAGKGAAGGAVSSQVAALARDVLRSMAPSRLRLWASLGAAAALVLLALLCWWIFSQRTTTPTKAVEQVAPAPKLPDDLARLQGAWQMMVVRMDGKDIPLQEPPQIWTIQGDRIRSNVGKLTQPSVIRLDATRRPREIDFSPEKKGKPSLDMKCVYELDGDELRICFTVRDNQIRPTRIDSTPGSGTAVMVLRRQPKG